MPSDTEALLRYVASQPLSFLYFAILNLLIGIFLLPSLLALYVVLRESNRSYMLASGLGAVGIVFLILHNVLVESEPGLSYGYIAAPTDAQRGIYVAATQAIRTASNLTEVVGSVLFASWIIITSLILLKAKSRIFRRPVAYIGIAVGILTFTGLFPVWSVLLGVWFILIGSKLYKLGR